MRQLLSIRQAARRLAVDDDTVRRRVLDGSLPAYRVGPRVLRIDEADLERLLRPLADEQREASKRRLAEVPAAR